MPVLTSEWLTAQAKQAAQQEELPPTSRPTGKPTGPTRSVLSPEWLSEKARRATEEEELPPTGRPTGKRLSAETLSSDVVRLPSPLLEKLHALWEQRKKKGHQESLDELVALLLGRAFHHVEEDDAEEGREAP